MTTIAENLQQIRTRILAASMRAGRDPGDVQLLAASKTVSVERLYEAVKAGQTLFGENRVQEGIAKIEPVGGGVRWHFIGHLQKNKVRPAVQWFDLIESVDSLALARAIQEEARRIGKRIPILLEVNVAGEKSKFGFSPQQVQEQIGEINQLTHIEIQGLMAIPPFCEKPEDSRPYFRTLREWQGTLEQEQGFRLPLLSMGMSHDFEVAIEEGATLVRVGTALFGKREASRAVGSDAD